MHVGVPVRWLLVLALTVALAGCRGASKLDVPIDGPAIEAGLNPAIDVRNFHGSVRILVDRRFSVPSVQATLKPAHPEAPRGDDLSAVCFIAAETVLQDGRAILRVLSETTLADPGHATADILVRVPDCGGVLVHNAGGLVELRGVAGAVTVENGTGNRSGGRVELRTGHPLNAPVRLSTTTGAVHLQVVPASRGKFDLTAAAGRAEFDVRGGEVATEVVLPDRIIATLNGGTNPVVLRSGSGPVRARIIENAATSIPPRLFDRPMFQPDPKD